MNAKFKINTKCQYLSVDEKYQVWRSKNKAV